MYAPMEHAVHAVAGVEDEAGVAAYVPRRHAVQLAEARAPRSVPYVPAGQSAHVSAEIAPSAVENMPAGHRLVGFPVEQAPPGKAPKVPAGHRLHALQPTPVAYTPGAHTAHAVAPTLDA
jgi:hypothetical protein